MTHVGVFAICRDRDASARHRAIADRRILRQVDGRRGGVLRRARNRLSRCRRPAADRQAVGRRHEFRLRPGLPQHLDGRPLDVQRRPGGVVRRPRLQRRAARNAGHALPGALLVVPAALDAVHLAARPDALPAGLRGVVRGRHRALSVRLLGRHPAPAHAVPRGRARGRGVHILRPERLLHRGAPDRRHAQSRAPAGARRRAVRHSHRQAAARHAAAGDPGSGAALADHRGGRGDDGRAGRRDLDAVRV